MLMEDTGMGGLGLAVWLYVFMVLGNEILLNVTVADVNEFEPFFVTKLGYYIYQNQLIQVYYPRIIQLQKCMPTLMLNEILRLEDIDVSHEYSFSIVFNSYVQLFEIDSETGEVYYLDSVSTPDYLYATFYIIVHQPPFSPSLTVRVDELTKDYIFTIKLENIKLDKIQERLETMSKAIGVYLVLVYWSLVEGYNTGMSEVWDINAHVYALDTSLYSHISIELLNRYIGNSNYSHLVAQPFTDAAYYPEEEVEYESKSDSYKTATIALGCVLGFVICLLVLNYVYQSYYRKKNKKYGNVSTLGQAYANKNYKGDGESNERVENVETVFGDASSTQRADESSLGKEIQMSSTLDQPGPSGLEQRQLDNISSNDSSERTENSSGVNTELIFPSTNEVDEISKDETTSNTLSSMENLGESKDAVSYPSLNESGSTGKHENMI